MTTDGEPGPARARAILAALNMADRVRTLTAVRAWGRALAVVADGLAAGRLAPSYARALARASTGRLAPSVAVLAICEALTGRAPRGVARDVAAGRVSGELLRAELGCIDELLRAAVAVERVSP